MILAAHVIFGAYGFWLPNDPRGSWSDFVGSWESFRFDRTKTDERCSLAHRDHDRALRQTAKQTLKYPAVKYNGAQAHAVGIGFGEYARKAGLIIHACAIMPDHVHLILARHKLDVESLVIQLKGAAMRRLVAERIHPFGDIPEKVGRPPKCFARDEWKVFLDCEDDIHRAIRYVEENPIKEGLPRQDWSYVMAYEALRSGNPPRRG